MHSNETPKTRPTLLKRASDWTDHEAWREFVTIYDPRFRVWCREYQLDAQFADEVCQQFLVELTDAMRTFCYDPSRKFRGWLRNRFRWRVLDAIEERSRRNLLVRSLDAPEAASPRGPLAVAGPLQDEEDEQSPRRLLMMELAEEVQAAVREKVQPRSWQVFWHVQIDGWAIRQTADALGMSYLAVWTAHRRVLERLVKEGECRLAEWIASSNDPRPES